MVLPGVGNLNFGCLCFKQLLGPILSGFQQNLEYFREKNPLKTNKQTNSKKTQNQTQQKTTKYLKKEDFVFQKTPATWSLS